MIWSNALKLSCFSTMNIIRQGDNLFDYASVNYLNDFDAQLFPNILYFATYKQWEKFRYDNGLSFVVVRELLATSEDFLPSSNTNLLFFTNENDFFAFYALLQNELSIERRMNGEMQRLFNMVADNVGLQKIVDKIAEIYHRPVTILDNAFSFIAHSQNYIFPESTLSEAVKSGHLLTAARNYLKKISIQNPKCKVNETILMDPNVKIGNKRLINYFTYIYLNNINICSFSVFEFRDDPIPENELRYLPQISSILSAELQKKSFYMLNKASYYTHLFSTLLEDQAVGSHDINDRLKQFGYKLGQYKYIVYVDCQNMFIAGTEIQLLADRLHYCFENSFYMVTEDAIIYFVSRDAENLLSQKEISSWNQLWEIESSNIKIGVSSSFENLSHTKQFYQDAREAITIGNHYNPDKKIYLYDDYRIANMIEVLAPHANLSSFCYPSLIRLVAYDESKGTNLSYTLFKFLENPKNPAQVCEELFIHKNTLYYRLNKISSIMGSSFESANEIAQINLTFAILKYQGRFDSLIYQGEGKNI